MKRHVVEPLLVLTLFFTYVAGALLLCVMGAGVYQRAADAMQSGYDRRTGALYLTEKVRQHDATAGVRVATLAESDALVLTTSVEGEAYETWSYVHKGYLCEVMVAAGSSVSPDGGQSIMPMAALRLSASGGMLHIHLTAEDGTVAEVDLAPRCAREGVDA